MLSGVAWLDRIYCSLSLIKISYFLIFEFRSCNSSCLLCISKSEVHLGSCMLFGGCYPVVMGSPCAGGCTLTGGAARGYCAGSAGSGALGSADTPSSAVVFVGGETSCASFCCPWGARVLVTNAVSGTNPCELVLVIRLS